MKKIFTLFFVLIFIQSALTQEKWSIDKSNTSKPPLSNYQILPGNMAELKGAVLRKTAFHISPEALPMFCVAGQLPVE